MRRSTFVTVLLLVAGPPGVHSASDTGTISGSVRITTRVRGNRLPTAAYSPRAVERHQPPATPELRNVLVYLKNVEYRGALPTTTSEIVQEHETFVPHVVAVTKGSTVAFPNSDPIFHNVFSLSAAGSFDLGRYPRGQSRSRTFTKPGLIKVYCQIHSQMSATIVVLAHPFFAVPADDGSFELRDVPDGQYTIVGWHERIGERSQTITVRSGEGTHADLSLPLDFEP